MQTVLDASHLRLGNVGVAPLVLAHESGVDANHPGKCTYVDELIILKQRREVKMKHRFSIKIRVIGNFPHLFHRVEEILTGFCHALAGADNGVLLRIGIIGDVAAVFLFLDSDFHR